MGRHFSNKPERHYSTEKYDWIDFMFGVIGALSVVLMAILFGDVVTR